MSRSANKRRSTHSAAGRIRHQIDAGGEHYWKIADFPDLAPATVAQTYSRLARAHVLQRVGKGLYYHPRPTLFGNSRPSENVIVTHRFKHRLSPAGLTAANRLGFTTQNPAVMEFATSANGVSPGLFRDQRARIYTRRPETWNSLPTEDAALLDFLRRRGGDSELSDQDTKDRLLKLLREAGRFDRLVAVAWSEPARVRAMLGAAGQEMNADRQLLADLRATLSPLSRFDFGAFSALKIRAAMAGKMRLYEHPDFVEAIWATRDYLAKPGLTVQLIEKDYYVTETLRVVANHLPGEIIFKGGTSLSKGWNLIQRLSEDIDLFVNPAALGKNAIDRKLKLVRDVVAEHPALEFCPHESKTIGGFGRSDYFRFEPRFTGVTAIVPRVFLEVGTSSGTYPTETRSISSYVATFLRATGATLGAEDESAFDMPLLHYRRTFVEKMFAIHAKVEMFKETGKPIGGFARHYYDLWCLARQPDVTTMLQSDEYADIKTDYERISLAAFPKGYRRPADMTFANSDALFPAADLGAILSADYDAQCQILCYDRFPSWSEIQATFEKLRQCL